MLKMTLTVIITFSLRIPLPELSFSLYKGFSLINDQGVLIMASSVTLASTTIEQQLIELVTRIQVLENNTANNPDGQNFVTGSANYDTGVFSGTFNIPFTVNVDGSGNPIINATAYLSD